MRYSLRNKYNYRKRRRKTVYNEAPASYITNDKNKKRVQLFVSHTPFLKEFE